MPGTSGIVIRVLVHHFLRREHYLPVVFLLGMFFRLFFIDSFLDLRELIYKVQGVENYKAEKDSIHAQHIPAERFYLVH